MMEHSYMHRVRGRKGRADAPETPAQGPTIAELSLGAVPTAAQMGRRVDLPGEIREKMESSFGADFSGVRLYESDTVTEAGANAVAQGTNIAFAPGKLDFTSTSGQALLGHELSHVVSQARGESAGQGFLNDASLEAQADRQGLLAAQGESAYAGPVSPVSVSSASGASGPIQASKDEENAEAVREAQIQGSDEQLPSGFHFIKQKNFRNKWLANKQRRQASPIQRRFNELMGSGEENALDNAGAFLVSAIHNSRRDNSATGRGVMRDVDNILRELSMGPDKGKRMAIYMLKSSYASAGRANQAMFGSETMPSGFDSYARGSTPYDDAIIKNINSPDALDTFAATYARDRIMENLTPRERTYVNGQSVAIDEYGSSDPSINKPLRHFNEAVDRRDNLLDERRNLRLNEEQYEAINAHLSREREDREAFYASMGLTE